MNAIDIHEVRRCLPHRFPFLMIDRVLEYTPAQSLTAIKNVTINEPFFPGHFPNNPVMPGVMIVEAIAQACAVLSVKTLDKLPQDDSAFYLVGIDKARFKRPVAPGDQLRIEVAIKRKMKGIWLFEGSAFVGDELCCRTELMAAVRLF